MIFYYVRHGEPIYVPNSLTEYGKKQAEALAKRFVLYGLDEIYSSPSTRARQTAEPTCKLLNKEPVLLDWTDEDLAWREFTITRDGEKRWCFHDRAFVEKFSTKGLWNLRENFIEDGYFDQTDARNGIKRIERETDASDYSF